MYSQQQKKSSKLRSFIIDFRDRLQISILILSEFKQINYALFSLKSSEKLRFSDDFRESRTSLIRLNSLNIRNNISVWFLSQILILALNKFLSTETSE